MSQATQQRGIHGRLSVSLSRPPVQVLQVYAPLGHALGLSLISSNMEDTCLSILFSRSYAAVQTWVRRSRAAWLDTLVAMRAQLQEALDADVRLQRMHATTSVTVRAKSAFSLMKKLLGLSGAHSRQAGHPVVHRIACLMSYTSTA